MKNSAYFYGLKRKLSSIHEKLQNIDYSITFLNLLKSYIEICYKLDHFLNNLTKVHIKIMEKYWLDEKRTATTDKMHFLLYINFLFRICANYTLVGKINATHQSI